MILNTPPFYLSGQAASAPATPKEPSGIYQIPHRGIHLRDAAPENSIDSAILAARCGFDIVECDIRLTSDNVWVLCHDHTINRTFRTRSGYEAIPEPVSVGSTSYDNLSEMYVLSSPNPGMRKAIPRFSDYLEVCRDLGLKVVPEFKVDATREKIEEAVNLANNILGWSNVFWQSFNWDVLRKVRDIDERLVLYPLANSPSVSHIKQLEGLKPYVYFSAYTVSSSIVEEFKNAGVYTAVWTVPPSSFYSTLQKNITEICTNHPAPAPDHSRSIASIRNIDEVSTTGVIDSGRLALGPGDTATILGQDVELGAYYLYMYTVEGGGSVSAANLSTSFSAPGFLTQSLLVGQKPDIKITAGPEGAVLSHLHFLQTEY